MRYLFWKRRNVLDDLPTALWSLHWNNNPWGQPPSQRSQWIGKKEVPIFAANQHEFLLYIGCTSSFDRRAQRIAQSLVTVLQSADVSFGILGDDEPCCGEAALSLGHKPYFAELSEKALSVFESNGVKRIVVISPHCYDVMLNEYPDNPDLEILHYTKFLSDLIGDEKLNFQDPVDKKVTLQDPCFLGRRNNQYEAPRDVIHSIPGITFVEMDQHGPDALCCGGGGPHRHRRISWRQLAHSVSPALKTASKRRGFKTWK
jgi:Fe-S oxidoreductase